ADLIQVWHAVGAFKTFGYSRLGMPGGPKVQSLNHRNYTKALVSSHNIADKYAEGFGIAPDKIQPLGIPRTDIFFDEPKKQAIRER
ncbi:CDP-glycerol glycerophosphotransferase family protein, partial [Lactiplantibacillus plantarum]